MEGLQGPINPCFFGEEHLDVETTKTLGFSCYGQLLSADHSLSFEEEEEEEEQPPRLTRSRSLEDKIPFLEMLEGVESPTFLPFCELSFQALLNLQQCKKPCDQSQAHSNYTPELMECSGRFQAPEQPESCLTHDVLEMQQHSMVKSETKKHPHSTCCAADGASSDCNQDQQLKPVEVEKQYCYREGNKSSGPETRPRDQCGLTVSPSAVNREKRKRTKRARPAKNKEEVESQRMTHIAVERNRRRQMNDHLSALRSLMPSSYIQRGDQASIIGGAIDFLKELEQLLQSLQAQKRMRLLDQGGGDITTSSSTSTSTSTSSSTSTVPVNGKFAATSPTSQYRNIKSKNCTEEGSTRRSGEFTAEKKSAAADVKVTVIQNHVNLKVECPRIAGQLLKAIVALEDLRLMVLHLNITSFETSVHYSFNLKIEDDCEVGSADGIAMAVHQIFSFVNGDT